MKSIFITVEYHFLLKKKNEKVKRKKLFLFPAVDMERNDSTHAQSIEDHQLKKIRNQSLNQ